ncbi:hypothetical protein MGN70_007313 [Eutypa lata]|nr:hypothetical protein MGN70_007313 [Eutypa lata]
MGLNTVRARLSPGGLESASNRRLQMRARVKSCLKRLQNGSRITKWRLREHIGATDYIDSRYEFRMASGGEFSCEVLPEAVDAFSFLQPEFVVTGVELGEAIDIACEALDGRDLDNATLV